VRKPSVLDRARKKLAHYIGPMAKLLVDRAAAKTKTSEALYQMLAAEIHSPVEREKFLKSSSK
jgi:serine/threonine-protein kinase